MIRTKKGTCKRCGQCCRYLAVELTEQLDREMRLYLIARGGHIFGKMLYLPSKCPFLGEDPTGKATCIGYDQRPKKCRDYDGQNDDGSKFPGCMFYEN